MITEFTCGIYTARYSNNIWHLHIQNSVGKIETDGLTITFNIRLNFSIDDFMQISVIMNCIKTQYHQLPRK